MYFHVFSSTRRRFRLPRPLPHPAAFSLGRLSVSLPGSRETPEIRAANALPTSPSSLKLDRLGCELDHPSYSRGLRLDLLLDNHPMT